MLTVESLFVRYGRIRALDGVSLTLMPGEILAVAGLNGAGKSSLVRAICGLTQVEAGRVVLDGSDITGEPLHRLEGVALLPEGRVLAPSLTVAETLTLGAGRTRSHALRARQEQVLSRMPELAKRLGQRAGTLSGGEATMLALARALMQGPRLLLLDEPTLGLSPAAAENIFGILADLRREGMGILLVEQNLHLALDLSDRVLLLSQGTMVREVLPTEKPSAQALEDMLINGGHQGALPC